MKYSILAKSLLALFIFSLSQVSYANGHSISKSSQSQNKKSQQVNNNQNSQQKKLKVKTFYLILWTPDQIAPADALPVEFGNNYQYRYTPNSHDVPAGDGAQQVVFKFHPDLKNRYKFRWISADQPQWVSFDKVKQRKIKVNVDAHTLEQDEDVYFEVWVYDTLTGEVLMCDPRVKIRV